MLHLAGHPALADLNIARTRVTDGALPTIARLAKLDALDLSQTAVTDEGVAWFSESNLFMLKLDGCRVTGRGLAASDRPPGEITWLSLVGCPVDDDGLRAIANGRFYRDINLSETNVTDAGLRWLGHLRHRDPDRMIPELCHVDLSATKITDAGLRRLKCGDVRLKLYLGDTAVTEAGIAAFERACPGSEASK